MYSFAPLPLPVDSHLGFYQKRQVLHPSEPQASLGGGERRKQALAGSLKTFLLLQVLFND